MACRAGDARGDPAREDGARQVEHDPVRRVEREVLHLGGTVDVHVHRGRTSNASARRDTHAGDGRASFVGRRGARCGERPIERTEARRMSVRRAADGGMQHGGGEERTKDRHGCLMAEESESVTTSVRLNPSSSTANTTVRGRIRMTRMRPTRPPTPTRCWRVRGAVAQDRDGADPGRIVRDRDESQLAREWSQCGSDHERAEWVAATSAAVVERLALDDDGVGHRGHRSAGNVVRVGGRGRSGARGGRVRSRVRHCVRDPRCRGWRLARVGA